jgi:peptide/nickel transport system ATP-binding protein
LAQPTLQVHDLSVHFRTRNGILRAVESVSFSVQPGEILGLVGESGSGKSVTGSAIMGLIEEPGFIAQGNIRFNGAELSGLPEHEYRKLRGTDIAIIFQNPMTSLNPVLRIETQMVEVILAHENVGHKQARARSRDALSIVGFPNPEEGMRAYPHQLSGGMRQRVAIAISILHRPSLIIADEPTTALDITIQSQILSEMRQLVARHNTSLIWISHDLSVVAGLADRLAVMYAGRIVESGPIENILSTPKHPYTIGLLNSVPSRNKPGKKLPQIPGTMAIVKSGSFGCMFRFRCHRASAECIDYPPTKSFPQDQSVNCWNANEADV